MTNLPGNSPLGQASDYPDTYDPGLLFAIGRAKSRGTLGLEGELPFQGTDIWNAWELTWLASNGQPQVAECEIHVPAASPSIVESKSLKLYLNSFSMSPFTAADEVAATIRNDLGACVGADVYVQLTPTGNNRERAFVHAPGICLDDPAIGCEQWQLSPELLIVDPGTEAHETLYSHLLRSLCPVTNQPDLGTLLIDYRGPRIDHAGLLRYIVSYRRHNDFHEACVERIFLDLKNRCGCESLTVYARYQRRGGIDINPFRTDTAEVAENLRLWRQ